MDGFCYRYDLFFGPHRIGDVIQDDVDDPNLWGTITYDPALGHPHSAEVVRLVRFLALAQAEWPASAVVESFQDLVKSDDWRLVDEQGRWSPIGCPLLGDEGFILWRWASVAEDAAAEKM